MLYSNTEVSKYCSIRSRDMARFGCFFISTVIAYLPVSAIYDKATIKFIAKLWDKHCNYLTDLGNGPNNMNRLVEEKIINDIKQEYKIDYDSIIIELHHHFVVVKKNGIVVDSGLKKYSCYKNINVWYKVRSQHDTIHIKSLRVGPYTVL